MHRNRFFRIACDVILSSIVMSLALCGCNQGTEPTKESLLAYAAHNARMQWWNEARFGLFIHWGVYSIPAGQWNGVDYPADWIRSGAEIPWQQYRAFAAQFNPVQFEAEEWVRVAKGAGMKYIVITAKHHDGFCLFDSKETDFDIMSTPFKRDILRALADACRKEGLRICWYYSIMDWDHPDYLPRMNWETDRPAEGADFDRYMLFLKNQIRELLTQYGDISVLWFDGEWESYWTKARAEDLYSLIRSLQPDIIVNDRLAGGRHGMDGYKPDDPVLGDYGVAEQSLPANPPPDYVYWETAQTINESFAYSAYDIAWKTPPKIIRNLVEAASRGGNFLLDVGPTPQGVFPQPAIDCLRGVGTWMAANGESIYGTKASPIPNQDWGLCTRRTTDAGVRLYLHVFEWPADGRLRIHGVFNMPSKGYLLEDAARRNLLLEREEDAVVVRVPTTPPNPYNSVIVLDFPDPPETVQPPFIVADQPVFTDPLIVSITSILHDVEIRYTKDGSAPSIRSPLVTGPIIIANSCTVSARCFRNGRPASSVAMRAFTKTGIVPAITPPPLETGLAYSYFTGGWRSLPDFSTLMPERTGVTDALVLVPPFPKDSFAFEYRGYIKIPTNGLYSFFLNSDDGSRLYVDDILVVDNDGAHPEREETGYVGLASGYHSLYVAYFESRGEQILSVSWKGPGMDRQKIPASVLFHEKR